MSTGTVYSASPSGVIPGIHVQIQPTAIDELDLPAVAAVDPLPVLMKELGLRAHVYDVVILK